MNVKKAKIINIILLVIACLVFLVGVVLSQEAAKEEASDVSKITVQITAKDCNLETTTTSFGSTKETYNINLTYSITNNTKVDWSSLTVKTNVYDKSGNLLLTLSTTFGTGSGFRLNAGDTTTLSSDFESNKPDDNYMTLYNSNLSDLVIDSEVITGTYYN